MDPQKPAAAASAEAATPAEAKQAADAKQPMDPEKKALKDAQKKEREEEKKKKHEAFDKKQALRKQQEEEKKKKDDEKKKKLDEEKSNPQSAEEKKEDAGDGKGKKKKAEKGEAPAIRLKQAYVNETPKGEKKDTSQPLKSYEPPQVEAAWYDWWVKKYLTLAKGFFTADAKSNKPKYVIVIPPPNVTGALHIGHALTNSIQDSLIRWHRMRGHEALWVPGTDHAGIATQIAVEKLLAKQGISRHDLGREKFLQAVWEWKEKYGNRIYEQLRRLGSSLDWTRESFTMDPKLSRAVLEAFLRLHQSGLMFRAQRMVNWVCRLRSVISDIEIDDLELTGPTKVKVPGYDELVEFGVLTEFAYEMIDETGATIGEIVVATTRPETMLGDTCIAVHPDDERYKKYHGKFAKHPFIEGRKLPIVCDGVLVDMNFGTGAVKVTPAHDPNDYNCALRAIENGIQVGIINILNDDGTINGNGGSFTGMPRYKARTAVLDALKDKKLYRDTKPNPMKLDICSRSGDIIEPMLKPQWFVNCNSMAAAANKAVETGELEILPLSQRETWNRWLSSPRDWCVSRQLWWGHRIPAWLPVVKGHARIEGNDTKDWIVARNADEAMAEARKRFPDAKPEDIKLEQDPDVLDTWFSSGLFPFSVFGWPEETADFAAFYPTSVLETGQDILFFWVARMVMMGLQLTGKLPFKRVLLHTMVRDAHGRKMSKSLGNVVDPIDVIEGITLDGLLARLTEGNLPATEFDTAAAGMREDFPKGISECGTDALRFGLCAYTDQDRDINMDPNKIEKFRRFCNKQLNAINFVTMLLGAGFVPKETRSLSGQESPIERWILSRLHYATKAAQEGFERFALGSTTDVIHRFWQEDFCDVLLEATKPVFICNTDQPRIASLRQTLFTCVDEGLRLLHPFMPFITEELWQRLPRRAALKAIESICIAPYPEADAGAHNTELESTFQLAFHAVHAVRSMRTEYNLLGKNKAVVTIRLANADLLARYQQFQADICTLSLSGEVHLTLSSSPAPTGCAVSVLDASTEVFLLLAGQVNPEEEIARLEKTRTKTQAELAALQKRMSGAQYDKVPKEVQEKNTQTVAALNEELRRIGEAIEGLRKLITK